MPVNLRQQICSVTQEGSMEDHEKKCEDPMCHCTVAAGERYCSSYCQNRPEEDGSQCRCGHEGCENSNQS